MNKLLLPALLFCLVTAFAQSNTGEVLYLKNGSVIRGKVIAPDPIKLGPVDAQQIKIELLGGSVFVFQRSEIDSIKRENTLKNQLKEIKHNYFRRERGYRNMTEFGIIYGTNLKKEANDPYYNYYSNQPTDDLGFSLHTVNGYQVWPYLFAGLGIGIDRFVSYKQTFSPFYLRVASEFLKTRVTPYVFCDVGYAVMWKKKNDDYVSYKNKGGLYVECGGGLRIYTQSRASVILSAAYKRNQSETEWWYTQYDAGTLYDVKRTYQRLTVNVGVTF
jgi:hypothetical protein